MQPLVHLAALQAQRPEFAIFRKWEDLRILRLLQLSAEIADLCESLGIANDCNAAILDPEKGPSPSSSSPSSPSHFGPHTSAQKSLREQLDLKLKQYDDCLIRYKEIRRLRHTSSYHLECLKEWLLDDDGGRCFLRGTEATIYDRAMLHDMISPVLAEGSQDGLTQFLQSFVVRSYHACFGRGTRHQVQLVDPFTARREATPAYYYSDKAILIVVETLSTLLASLLPALTSLALFFIHSQLSKMGAIIGFTVLFSCILLLITTVKRSECFAITAAFSAVLVVFVGNNDVVECNC